MKKIILITLVIFVLNSAQCDELDPSYNYDQFIAHFKRDYTGEERLKHERIFNANYLDLIKRKMNGEDVVVNQFLDWDDQQKSAFFNYKPQKFTRQLSTPPLRSQFLFASPTSFDWRSLGRVTSVKNQGSCGSCWAFAATAQYESALAIETNGTLYDLSEQYGLECDTFSLGCNGGYPPDTLALYNKTGIPLEVQYPYKANSTYYPSTVICNEKNTTRLTSKVPLIYHYSNLTEQQIQQNLIAYGPTTVGVSASGPFSSAGPSGLINNCIAGAVIDHAVLLVGYNTTHWFIKNSWDTWWGDKGHGYINKTNDCQLKTWVDIMQVNYPVPPPPQPTPQAPAGYENVKINMTDKGSNGWSGTTLGLSQNGVVVASFGGNFTSGAKLGPVLATLSNVSQTSIVVVKLGTYTNEIGFNITHSNGTLLFNRLPGTTFTAATVLGKFCITSVCIAPISITYYVTLTSSCGNGWGGNTLAIRQNNSIIATIGANFTTGNTLATFNLTLKSTLQVDIIVGKLANGTQRVGIILRTTRGYIVFQRQPGASYFSNSLLGSFVPNALNYVPEDILQQEQQTVVAPTEDTVSQSTFNKVLVATIVLGASQLFMLGILVFMGVKLFHLSKGSFNRFSSNTVMTQGNNPEHVKHSQTTSMPGSATLLKIS